MVRTREIQGRHSFLDFARTLPKSPLYITSHIDSPRCPLAFDLVATQHQRDLNCIGELFYPLSAR